MKKTRRCRRTFAAVLIIMTVIALFAVVLAALRHRALTKAEPMINEEPERSSCEALDEPQTPQLKCGAGLRNVTSVLFPNLTHCTHTEDDLVSMLLLRDGYFIDCLWSTHMTSLAIYFMRKSAACRDKRCIQQRLIVDVGANIGSCTLPMVAQASQWARVVAFEPTRINGRALYYSLAVNGLLPCVTVVESAAWEPDPRSHPLKPSDPDDLEVERRIRRRIIYFERQNLGHAVVLENDGADQIPGVEMEEVLITTFTNEMKNYVLSLRDDGRGMAPVRLSSLQIPFMKIDTEGTELAVLRGSAPFFAAHQVWIVMIEVNVKVSVVAGFSSSQMLTLLREWGYRLYYVQGSTASGGRGSHVVQDITPFVQSCLDHPKNVFGILPRLVEGYSDDGEASLLTYLNMTESELLSRYRAA